MSNYNISEARLKNDIVIKQEENCEQYIQKRRVSGTNPPCIDNESSQPSSMSSSSSYTMSLKEFKALTNWNDDNGQNKNTCGRNIKSCTAILANRRPPDGKTEVVASFDSPMVEGKTIIRRTKSQPSQ